MPVSNGFEESHGGGGRYMDRHSDEEEGLELTEELSGFSSGEEHRGEDDDTNLRVGETMSDIGRVVSQTEAGMDFTTNLEAPMVGVQRQRAGTATNGRAASPSSLVAGPRLLHGARPGLVNGGPSPYEDMSMSRLADSHWRAEEHSGMHEFPTRDDLESMASHEFSTQSASARNGRGLALQMQQQRNGGVDAASDSFLMQTRNSTQQQNASFYSDSQQQQQQQQHNQRQQSYEQPLPTFSSASGALPTMESETANDRLARLVARYSDSRSQAGGRGSVSGDARRGDVSSVALSDEGGLPALPDSPDVPTALTSVVYSMARSPSIVERTRTALQRVHMASPDRDGPSVDGPSYSEMRRRFLVGTANRSAESLDHPNLGSQGSVSPGRSVRSMGDGATGFFGSRDDGRRHDEDEFQPMAAGDQESDDGMREYDMGASGGEEFRSVDDPDAMFGDHMSDSSSNSNPNFSDIVRDHEQVFSDLFGDSDHGSDGDGDERHDSTQAPASLFASSSSIVAEISRRKQRMAAGAAQRAKLTSWDGREATPDAMRRQEAMYGLHAPNPIEMQGRANSLGLDDSDVSGLLPPSEYSPRGPHATVTRRMLTPPPPSAPASAARPPTTPTTIIARDTRHGPASRVLHNVPPFAPLDGPRSATANYAPARAKPAGPRSIDSGSVRGNRPPMLELNAAKAPALAPKAGTPDQRRNARAAAHFAQATSGSGGGASAGAPPVSAPAGRVGGGATPSEASSHGLGSLFHDSLPHLEEPRSGGPPPAFHALSRLLNTSAARSPGGGSRQSPLRQQRQQQQQQPQEWGISGTSSMLSASGGAHYVPFQDPTVDISNLPRYQEVDLKRSDRPEPLPPAAVSEYAPWSLARGGALPQPRAAYESSEEHRAARAPLSPAYGSPSAGSVSLESLELSDMGLDEPPSFSARGGGGKSRSNSRRATQSTAPRRQQRDAPASAPAAEQAAANGGGGSGPTLSDIYELLRRTVSTIDAQQHAQPPVASLKDVYDDRDDDELFAELETAGTARFGSPARSFAAAVNQTAASSMRAHLVPRQLRSAPPADQSYPDLRPSAPTPRRSRHLQPMQPGAGGVDGSRSSSTASGRSDAGQARVRAYLQRYMSEPEGMDRGPPPPRAVHSGVQTDGEEAELAHLQREILARFDACRSEVDQLRSEVRRKDEEDKGARMAPPPPESPTAQRLSLAMASARRVQPRGSRQPTPSKTPSKTPAALAGDEDDGALSDTSTTVPEHVARSPLGGDLLATREGLDALRQQRRQQHGRAGKDVARDAFGDAFGDAVYGNSSSEMARQLGAALAELQRVHMAQFHDSPTGACPVCRTLEAQNHDPYLFGRRAVAYRSMTTRQLQALLNAYVAAMEEDAPTRHAVARSRRDPPAAHVFTPSRKGATAIGQPAAAAAADPGAAVVIGLLRDELAALGRRYHRLADDFRRLDPSRPADQCRRRTMARDLKDLVDVLDVKGEQIAVLAALHPGPAMGSAAAAAAASDSAALSPADRALQSARALQHALGDLY